MSFLAKQKQRKTPEARTVPSESNADSSNCSVHNALSLTPSSSNASVITWWRLGVDKSAVCKQFMPIFRHKIRFYFPLGQVALTQTTHMIFPGKKDKKRVLEALSLLALAWRRASTKYLASSDTPTDGLELC